MNKITCRSQAKIDLIYLVQNTWVKCIFLIVLCVLNGFAQANDKVALVIGNSQYQTASDVLKNPVNDAQAVGKKLKDLGYETQILLNANLGQTLGALNKLNQRVSQGGTVVLYYAGHGVQLDGQNYIVPVDASMQDRDYVSRQAIKVQELVDKLEQTQSSNRIVILDACRNDPFPKQYRSGNRGLVREQLQSNEGLMILYAASPNEVADDGTGKHGVFTQALLNGLNLAGTRLPVMMDDIRAQVRQQTSGKQNPYYEGTGLSRFMFLPAPTTQNEKSSEATAWKQIKNSKNPTDFQTFLKQYPSGVFSDAAKVMLTQLSKPISTTAGKINPQHSRSTDNDELIQKGMWRDPKTGLTWMRCHLGETWTGEPGCTGKPTTQNWNTVQKQIEELNQTGFAGYKDWRLPHVEELTSLLYCSTGYRDSITIPTKSGSQQSIPNACNGLGGWKLADWPEQPTIKNLTVFFRTEKFWYWTSTPQAGNKFWAVSFFHGASHFAPATRKGFYVYLVRD